MLKIQMFETAELYVLFVSLEYLNFEFVSDFEFRTSDFLHSGVLESRLIGYNF